MFKRIMPWLFIGVFVAGFLYFMGQKKTMQTPIRAPLKSSAQSVTMEMSSEARVLDKKPEKETSARNPFSFAVKESLSPLLKSRSAGASDLKFILQGFVKKDGKYAAFINDEMVEKGDKVSGWVVESVSENNVVLEKGGKEKVLRF